MNTRREIVREARRLQERGAVLVHALEDSLLAIDRLLDAGELVEAEKLAAALASGIRRRRGGLQ